MDKRTINPISAVKKTCFALVISAIVLAVIIPFLFFLNTSLTSTFDMYKYPKKLIPRFSYNVMLTWDEAKPKVVNFHIEDGNKNYELVFSSGDTYDIRKYLEYQLNVVYTDQEIESQIESAKANGEVFLKYNKSMLLNFKQFFLLTSGAGKALMNSVTAAVYTILISLFFGSLSGYAMARYKFKFREFYSVSLLFVRIYPVVAITLPMIVLIIGMGFYDTMLALGIVYSIPNIALTAWITNSIFSGIGLELEEASVVFGATKLRTFFKITLPLAFPGLVASSMYAFLAAWNDSITALMMTNQNQTLALVIYKNIGTSASSSLHIAAAGAIILLLPSLVFTFIVKNYINQLWGSSSI